MRHPFRFALLIISLTLLWPLSPFAADRVMTLWPLADYRRSDAVDYTNLSLLGPLINYERKGEEFEVGVRPLWYYSRIKGEDRSFSEYLYPVLRREHRDERTYYSLLNLWDFDNGPKEDRMEDRLTLFPFIFYTKHRSGETDFAFFPFGGRMRDRFWRDKISFALFPLYGKTEKKGTEVTNVLWPFFAKIGGENTHGFKFWPFFGYARKEGVYRKKFVLWPFYFKYDLDLDTANPRKERILFPFYMSFDSPDSTRTLYLWPLYDHEVNRREKYEKWDFPWPLFRIARGEYWHGYRFLPFASNETIGGYQSRWVLWPFFNSQTTTGEMFTKTRHRFLYFLYSDSLETFADPSRPEKKIVSLWPLFTYKRTGGVSRFQTLSLLQPFFPESEGVERNWSPLWGLYVRKWDTRGNEISSLLWNLYWKERRGDDLSFEIFPFIRYTREEGRVRELKLLKGLFAMRRDATGRKRYRFFFFPFPKDNEVQP